MLQVPAVARKIIGKKGFFMFIEKNVTIYLTEEEENSLYKIVDYMNDKEKEHNNNLNFTPWTVNSYLSICARIQLRRDISEFKFN